uniref:U-box domain-containing protein n=1 Tax=Paramoeba aestuarina TaxID=180227 RepID=A0A7S4KVX2_9EUKA|eukprot:CAMPEP_0201506520 /NCGR_PEP_ID=MMETSP0161_2-20130828/451_1 /ASSEMBLY_ACC=CAM_ASM_000251 /TAXON_ID=180227 /ORGANISM="Neoparamoeba aestuarina, Strain SoJaBio B1-5/56/2" /LENGTH=781 /DNA_ID=CAMNT_0047900637 /DNA_START=19 /DNA_END=2364 /DNA_ORIENTATION=-
MAAEPKDVPDRFLCPITHEIMQDPVGDGRGHFFERKAITDWLSKNDTCPLTRQPLSVVHLTDAIALKKEIELFRGTKSNEASNPPGAVGGVRDVMKLKSFYTKATETPFPLPTGAEEGDEDYFLHVQVDPGNHSKRTPVDVCCVVDVSGSMQITASVQDDSGKQLEDEKLSILCVVKHAVKTIIHALTAEDRLSLVSFSSNAKRVLELTKMNAVGKKKAEAALETMKPSGATNLWDGLHTGMETLRTNNEKGRYSACLLLTDGQPNIEPPLGHLPSLRKYKRQHEHSCSINTFGFGYDIDSELLTGLAAEGGGNYVFTPDGGFVGTAFVNALSNLLSTFAHSVEVVLDPKEGASTVIGKGEDCVLGAYPLERIAGGGAVVKLGCAHFSQPRDFVIPVRIKRGSSANIKDCISVVARYVIYNGTNGKTSLEGEAVYNDIDVQTQLSRLFAADKIRESSVVASYSLSDSQQLLKDCIATIFKSSSKSQGEVKALLKDLTGQATQALSKQEWFARWGRHYLPSLSMSHSSQLCTNFKDPGLQVYGGALFKEIQDKLDTIFLSLPPPQPQQYVAPAGLFARAPRARAPANMANYYNVRGGCFAAHCLVTMGDGSLKKVSEVQRGDVVSTGSGGTASVVCVLKTVFRNSPPMLVSLPGGLQITEYHPVRINGKWEFPIDLVPSAPCSNTPSVCSFVLDRGHVCVVNGVECVGLGHDFKGDVVVEHPFFGSQKVVEAMKIMQGWDRGLIVLQANAFLKSDISNLIERLDLSKEIFEPIETSQEACVC